MMYGSTSWHVCQEKIQDPIPESLCLVFRSALLCRCYQQPQVYKINCIKYKLEA